MTRGAASPSISADGRFVAFSTGERLAPADTNGNVDVYVRDLTLSPAAPGAYDLVSARSGGDVPAAYTPRPDPAPGRDPGAEITRASAISDDGRYVVFRTLAASDLPAGAPGSAAAGQLVRDVHPHLGVPILGRQHPEPEQSIGRNRVEQRCGETRLPFRPDGCHDSMLTARCGRV